MILYLGLIALFIYALYNEYITARQMTVLVGVFIVVQIICILKHLMILGIISFAFTLIYLIFKISADGFRDPFR